MSMYLAAQDLMDEIKQKIAEDAAEGRKNNRSLRELVAMAMGSYGDFCHACGGIAQGYMLHDKIWKKLRNQRENIICLQCIRKRAKVRLKRRLTWDDFTPAMLNISNEIADILGLERRIRFHTFGDGPAVSPPDLAGTQLIYWGQMRNPEMTIESREAKDCAIAQDFRPCALTAGRSPGTAP